MSECTKCGSDTDKADLCYYCLSAERDELQRQLADAQEWFRLKGDEIQRQSELMQHQCDELVAVRKQLAEERSAREREEAKLHSALGLLAVVPCPNIAVERCQFCEERERLSSTEPPALLKQVVERLKAELKFITEGSFGATQVMAKENAGLRDKLRIATDALVRLRDYPFHSEMIGSCMNMADIAKEALTQLTDESK